MACRRTLEWKGGCDKKVCLKATSIPELPIGDYRCASVCRQAKELPKSSANDGGCDTAHPLLLHATGCMRPAFISSTVLHYSLKPIAPVSHLFCSCPPSLQYNETACPSPNYTGIMRVRINTRRHHWMSIFIQFNDILFIIFCDRRW